MTEQQVLYLYYVIVGFAAAAALYRLRRTDRATRFLCFFILYALVNEILSAYSISLFRNNYILSNLYDYISFILLGAFFYLSAEHKKAARLILLLLIAGMAALPVNILLFPDFTSVHQYLTEQISGFLILVISLYTIYNMVLRDEDAVIYRIPLFWIATVFVFYQLINLWGRSAYHPFELRLENDYFYFIILGINILLYSLLGVFLWRHSRMKLEVHERR